MSLEAIPPGPEAEDVFGGWREIAGTVVQFVSQLPGLRGGSVVVDLLVALTDAQHGQTALLKSIKADTAALRIAPLKEALQSLEEARRVGPADPLWDTFIRRAEANLSTARALVSGPHEQALVEFNLGIVYLAMGHKDNARYHLEQSVQCADRAVNGYVQKAGMAIEDRRPATDQPKVLVTPLRAAGAIAGGVGWLLTGGSLQMEFAAAMTPGGRRACQDLKGFIGFYNLIQRTATSLSGHAQPRYLAFEGGGGYGERPLIKGLFQQGSYPYSPYVLRRR